jgi:hypothetical protein
MSKQHFPKDVLADSLLSFRHSLHHQNSNWDALQNMPRNPAVVHKEALCACSDACRSGLVELGQMKKPAKHEACWCKISFICQKETKTPSNICVPDSTTVYQLSCYPEHLVQIETGAH